MNRSNLLSSALIGACALLFTAAQFAPGHQQFDKSGPVLAAAASFVNGQPDRTPDSILTKHASSRRTATGRAVNALAAVVGPLSSPEALADAVRSYFAFKTAHPEAVRNPYLYFVDFGLPSTEKRGYVFDMSSLKVIEGPFTVAHGRGSWASLEGVPTRFSNAWGSEATSLGLYLTGDTYPFRGKSRGHSYRSIGLQLIGVSDGYNDNALSRRVVAHGAPYVTPTRAGQSEGCPAMEQSRARQLLPKLANGGMVFLFAPDSNWLTGDPWITAASE